MAKRVYWSDESKLDIHAIINFLLFKWNNKVATIFLDNLDEFVFKIAENPTAFPYFSKELGIRKCVISQFNSVYYVDELERIEILRVRDNRQNPKDLSFK